MAITTRRTALALAAMLPAAAAAQDAASPGRVYIGFAAGGGTDVMARLILERMRAEGGPSFVVINRPGASGRLAVDALRQGPADGSVLMVAPFAVPVMNPALFPGTNQESGRDYLPVSLLATTEFAVAVHAAHPARDMRELIAWLRANPREANFGTATLGNMPHFLGLELGRAIGVEMTPVGYRGSAPMMTDLVAGTIRMAISIDADFAGVLREGRVRLLATAGQQPSRLVPEAPTLASLGLGLVATGYNGLFAPVGTPPEAMARVAAAVSRALAHPETRDRLLAMGLVPSGAGPAEFARVIAADAARWQPVIRASGFRVE
jgi:tripartite-type tricarboxylate transporter receptor subunit TctC